VRPRYTLPALANVSAILDYIAAHSPQGARRVQARIHALTDLLFAASEHRHPHERSGDPPDDERPLKRPASADFGKVGAVIATCVLRAEAISTD
jgi:hypothetical protein